MEQFLLMYGGAALSGFFATLFLLALLIFLGKRLPFSSSQRHHSPVTISRLGGVGLIGGFTIALWHLPQLVFPLSWWAFLGALGAGLLLGLWDDIKNLNWKYQLAGQGGILLLLYAGGVKILTVTNPFGGMIHFSEGLWVLLGGILFLGWGVLVLNSVNWLDGIDGLCGSVMAIAFASLFFLSLSPFVYQPAIALLLAAALGATFAFLIYNFHPAKIIGGTSGALFFGLVTVFVSVVAGTKIATTLLILALPILDTAFVLLKRFQEKRSLFASDKGHLHHILQSRGWSDRKIVAAYSTLTFLIGLIALSTERLGKLVALILIAGILVSLLTFFHFSESRGKKWAGVMLMSILSIGFMAFLWQPQENKRINAWIDGQWYALEVANSPEERRVGLSGRENICLKCGMLFVFPEETEVRFWMKDMHFSLDILWLQENRVVEKHEQLPYPSTETFGPKVPIDKVIELPAGAAKDIPIGTKVFFW